MSWLVIGCVAALFVWAFAEAFAWPVVPDVALASLVFLLPSAAPPLVVATVAGSVVGGVVAMTAHCRGWRWPLPLVSDAMRSRVEVWLDRGPIGLVHQPLTAVPYKAFVVEGARRGLPRLPWAWWTAVFRGARMGVVAGLAAAGSALVEYLFPASAPAARLVVLGIGLIVFAIGWRIAWRVWADPQGSADASTAAPSTRTMRP